ncbi:hypothetical protein JCM19239_1563 [Vibrio variabilis]|uniref:Uncharacterized protein n=1 Tax=Vibrio variabilis TaxID=990271 RepID=A0ABQ0JIB3_9VIBR|nr:hypothetical protein JCM19239_1563 [Vibrio variabilis]
MLSNLQIEAVTRHEFDYYCCLTKQWVAIHLSCPQESVAQIRNIYIQDGFEVREPN